MAHFPLHFPNPHQYRGGAGICVTDMSATKLSNSGSIVSIEIENLETLFVPSAIAKCEATTIIPG
jgi:hypothetical protein